MSEILVSVLMPCYNAEEFVEESMNSILNQTHQNLEIIAINDCSTDNTKKILEDMATKDKRIRVINNEENFKLIRTLNKGIALCNAEYIARMDSDDIALPTRIEKELKFLEENKDYDIVSTQFDTFPSSNPQKLNRHHNPTRFEELQAYMLFKSGICHPAVMIRKRLFSELGLSFGTEYLHVEDYALWSEAIYLTKIANLPESLLKYRVHESQVSTQNEQLQIENKKKVYKIHCNKLGLPTNNNFLNIYSSLAESVPYRTKDVQVLDDSEQFALNLIDINKKISFCDKEYLKQMLSLHWLRLCANSRLGYKAIQRAKQSPLYKPEYYSRKDLLILYVKCALKLEYKKSLIHKAIFR